MTSVAAKKGKVALQVSIASHVIRSNCRNCRIQTNCPHKRGHPLIRPLSQKAIPLIRLLSQKAIPLIRPLSQKAIPLIRPDFRCTESKILLNYPSKEMLHLL